MKNNIIIAIAFIMISILSGIVGFFIGKSTISDSNNYAPPFTPSQQACTMEAKICPDGSSVGRTGPNCEFSPCPEMGIN